MYLLMGNHDLKYENKLDIDNKEETMDKCHIINEEMKFKDEFIIDSYAHLMNQHTICLFINTLLYTEDQLESEDCISIYRNMKLNNKQHREIDEKILTNILLTISRYHKLKNIIVVGHDPIVTRKIKKGKYLKKPLDDNGLKFLHELYSIVPDAKNYYLCADTHNYQHATITLEGHNIEQYVVGTGGTELDNDHNIKIDNDPEPEPIENNINLLYRLNKIEISYGYLICNDHKNNGNLVFNFKSVAEPEKRKGTKKKKKKKKKKNTRRNKSPS